MTKKFKSTGPHIIFLFLIGMENFSNFRQEIDLTRMYTIIVDVFVFLKVADTLYLWALILNMWVDVYVC